MSRDQGAVHPHDPARESTERLGQRLRRARLSRNLTQGELAKNQFSISYISGVERGQIRPSLGALERLAEILQIPVTELLAGSEFDMPHTSSPVQHREAIRERQREELESGLREAQILGHQNNNERAITTLLRLQSQQLTPRESATLQLSLATCYRHEGRAEDARRVAQDAIPVAERSGELDLAARLRLELGHAWAMTKSHATALQLYQQWLRSAQEQVIQDPSFRLSALLDLGTQYCSLAEYERAITVLIQAVDVAEEVMQPEALGEIYWNISRALDAKGDQDEARSYRLRSTAAYEEAANRRMLIAIFNRLGTAFAGKGQLGPALAQLSRAETMASGQHDLRGIAEAKRNLALIYLAEKRNTEASQAAHEALSAAERLGDRAEQASSLLVFARVQEALNQTSEATLSLEHAILLLQSTDAPLPMSTLAAGAQLREAYAQFSEYLERQGESKRAFEMLKQAYKSTQHI